MDNNVCVSISYFRPGSGLAHGTAATSRSRQVRQSRSGEGQDHPSPARQALQTCESICQRNAQTILSDPMYSKVLMKSKTEVRHILAALKYLRTQCHREPTLLLGSHGEPDDPYGRLNRKLKRGLLPPGLRSACRFAQRNHQQALPSLLDHPGLLRLGLSHHHDPRSFLPSELGLVVRQHRLLHDLHQVRTSTQRWPMVIAFVPTKRSTDRYQIQITE